jgi:hypothetical protein
VGELKDLNFVFDESVPKHVLKALKALRIPRVAHFNDLQLRGVKDEVWLRQLSGHRLVVLSNDHRLLTVPHEKQALQASDLGFIAIKAGEKKVWEQARDILWWWERIAKAGEHDDRPFAYKLTRSKLERCAL